MIQTIAEIISAVGTLTLAIAAYYQIYHTAHKEEAMRPRLIIFPDFNGGYSHSQIGFDVYNIGKTVAKNCKVDLEIIRNGDGATISKISWSWSKYDMTTNLSGDFNTELINTEGYRSKDIYSHEKASLTYLTVETLYGKGMNSTQKVPRTDFVIKVVIISENMATPGIYVLSINWTGDYFDIMTDQIDIAFEKRKILENKLDNEKMSEFRNISRSYFLRKRRF